MANAEIARRRAVVFGANGSVGRELTRQLAEKGITTTAVVRKGKERETFRPGIIPCGINFDDIGDITGVIKGATEIYYAIGNVTQGVPSLRSQAYLDALDVNTTLPLTIREHAPEQGVRFVYMSSIAVYGEQGGNITERAQRRGEGIYALTKIQTEDVLKDRFSMPPTTIVRPANIFGPGATIWSEKVYNLAKKRIPADGKGSMPVVDIRDVAKAMIRSVEVKKAEYGIYNLAADSTISVNEVGQLYQILTDVQPKFAHAYLMNIIGKLMDSYSKITGNAVYATSENIHNLNDPTRSIDNTKAKLELGIEFTSIKKTMQDTLLWLNKKHKLGKEEKILETFAMRKTL